MCMGRYKRLRACLMHVWEHVHGHTCVFKDAREKGSLLHFLSTCDRAPACSGLVHMCVTHKHTVGQAVHPECVRKHSAPMRMQENTGPCR